MPHVLPLVLSALSACEPATPRAIAAPAGGAAHRALLDLPVHASAPRDGYSRDQFGPRWADIDHNGCDQRNDVLARDLTDLSTDPTTHNCVVLSGTLHDPYTGQTIAFVRGPTTSDDVQIDHVVSLSNAWASGAQGLPAAVRTQLANDPLNLLAVDGPTNQSKGDHDAAGWLPPNPSVHCAYAARQVAVKRWYGLWVTPAERDALADALAGCGEMDLPDGQEGLSRRVLRLGL